MLALSLPAFAWARVQHFVLRKQPTVINADSPDKSVWGFFFCAQILRISVFCLFPSLDAQITQRQKYYSCFIGN